MVVTWAGYRLYLIICQGHSSRCIPTMCRIDRSPEDMRPFSSSHICYSASSMPCIRSFECQPQYEDVSCRPLSIQRYDQSLVELSAMYKHHCAYPPSHTY